MNKVAPWTISLLVAGLVIVGSVALAQWEPVHREPVKWFTPPPITEDALNPDWQDQELCYLVIRLEGRPVPFQYIVRPHYRYRRDTWFLPPVVIREERSNVWEKLVEAFNRVSERP